MASIFGNNSIFAFMNTVGGAMTATMCCLIILCIVIVIKITGLNIFELIQKFLAIVLKISRGFINSQEVSYHRDLEIGKIDEKRKRVKIYRFLNDLTIDLGLKQKGATPYEFLMIVCVATFMGTVLVCQMLFGSFFISFIFFPIALCGVICTLYTRANIAHDKRIEAIIEAENTLCNNIQNGTLVAVKSTLNVLPPEVKKEFRDFVDNIESKNFHIRTALMELNNNLGSVADDFIKKCIVLETEEEHGIVGMFRDVVEVNNIKMEMRTNMRRRFEEVKASFITGALMIFSFLVGVMVIYPNVANFYLHNVLGNIIIAIDALLLIIEFVYITYLNAQDL